MIERFRMDGYTIAGETRTSGDGYYEGVIRDPDGNIIEIVANGEPEIQVALFPPYELLLEADPDREKVEAYLKDSDCFIATVRNSVAGVIVVRKEEGGKAEIMNLAVADIFRREESPGNYYGMYLINGLRLKMSSFCVFAPEPQPPAR